MTYSPNQQQEQFFQWFAKMGVHRFDIQLREPDPRAGASPEAWRWLKPSVDVSTSSFFLKFSSWARFMNSKGADVYIRPHSEVQHGVVFLDDLPLDKAIQLSKKYAACVVCTSQNNTQVWLATDRELSKAERKCVQSWMRSVGYTDPGSVSGDHLGRLCGVRSQKRNCWVNLIATTFEGRYVPKISTPLSSPVGEACASPFFNRGSSLTTGSGKTSSASEREFGWAMGALKNNVPLLQVINYLCAQAKQRGKRNPEDYANRTAMGAYRILNRG